MGKIGSALGGFLGKLGGDFLPIPGINGGQFGNFLGGLMPFRRGGRVGVRKVRKVKKSKPRRKK